MTDFEHEIGARGAVPEAPASPEPPPGEPWRIDLFGRLRVLRGEETVDRFRTRKTEALLAFLAYHRDRPHSRDRLADMLWPDSDGDTALANLSSELSWLRKRLDGPARGDAGSDPSGRRVLLTRRDTIQLNAAAVATDVGEFEAALEAARRARSSQEGIEALTAAVGAYQGELWPAGSDPWLIGERQRLGDAYVQAVLKLIGLLVEHGDADAALLQASRAVRIDPAREEIHEAIIRLYAGADQPAAALQQYQELERILDRDLGTVPSEEITGLVRACAARPRARTSGRISWPGSPSPVEDVPIPFPLQSAVEGDCSAPGTAAEATDAAPPESEKAETVRRIQPRGAARLRALPSHAALWMTAAALIVGARPASVDMNEPVPFPAHAERILPAYLAAAGAVPDHSGRPGSLRRADSITQQFQGSPHRAPDRPASVDGASGTRAASVPTPDRPSDGGTAHRDPGRAVRAKRPAGVRRSPGATGSAGAATAVGVGGLNDVLAFQGRTVASHREDVQKPSSESFGGDWICQNPMHVPRGGLSAALGADDRIYVFGGSDNLPHLVDTVEAFDARRRRWDPLPALRDSHYCGAAVNSRGSLYVLGGHSSPMGARGTYLSSVERYDPDQGVWRVQDSMPTARYGLAAAVGTDGAIYALGGENESQLALRTAEVYRPRKGWSPMPDMRCARNGLAAAAGRDGRIYAIGGADSTGASQRSVEAFDPRTRTWSFVAPLATGRHALAAALGPDGRIYAIGGTERVDRGVHRASTAVEVYDPVIDRWSSLPPLPNGRSGLAAVTGRDGVLYLLGGIDPDGDCVRIPLSRTLPDDGARFARR